MTVIITLCPLALNHSTHISIPRQENISEFPCDMATLDPSMTIGRRFEFVVSPILVLFS